MRQSDFESKNRQEDGWGIGWFEDGAPKIAKSPRAAFKDAARFRAAAEKARSTAVIGHIRAASNPRGIRRSTLINMANTQPFTDGEWVFGHNGTLEIPLQVAAELGPLRKKLKSQNDSEVYFWQFRKFLDKLGDGGRAFEACIRETWEVWRDGADKATGKKTPYTSLNAVVSDGRTLYAFCHSVRSGLAQCGVCNPSQPWQVMSFAERDGALLVASENLDTGRWTRFATPEVLTAFVSDGRVEVERARYDLGPKGLVKKSEEAALR